MANIQRDGEAPLFRAGRKGALVPSPLNQSNIHKMIGRRAAAAGIRKPNRLSQLSGDRDYQLWVFSSNQALSSAPHFAQLLEKTRLQRLLPSS